MTKLEMITHIDQAADAARLRLVQDPLRTFEYYIAEGEAIKFKEANFQGDVPNSVSSWASALGVSNHDAAEDILEKAQEWRNALYYIRSVRLNGKSQVSQASDDDAMAIYLSTIQQLKVF